MKRAGSFGTYVVYLLGTLTSGGCLLLLGLLGACTCLWVCCLLVATEDFLNWIYCIHMACVGEVLGIHVHMLRRYGVSPDEAVEAAVAKLQPTVPHIARLLLELASLH